MQKENNSSLDILSLKCINKDIFCRKVREYNNYFQLKLFTYVEAAPLTRTLKGRVKMQHVWFAFGFSVIKSRFSECESLLPLPLLLLPLLVLVELVELLLLELLALELLLLELLPLELLPQEFILIICHPSQNSGRSAKEPSKKPICTL